MKWNNIASIILGLIVLTGFISGLTTYQFADPSESPGGFAGGLIGFGLVGWLVIWLLISPFRKKKTRKTE